MAVPQIPPIPLRSQQGFPFTSLTHDDIHGDLAGTVALLVDTVNSIIAATGTSVPTGVSLAFAGTVLPSGFLWEDGSAVSRTTYAALYAVLGGASSPWGQGNGTTTFNLPSPQGRSRIYSNPLNSLSASSPTLSARVLGTKYGAETYTNAAIPVTGSTPSIGVSFSNMGTVAFPTFSAGTKDSLSYTAPVLTFSAGTKDTLTFSAGTKDTLTFSAGTKDTLSAGTPATWGVMGLSGAPGDIALTITAPTAVYGGDPATKTVVIPTITGTVASIDIAATLTLNPSGYVAPSLSGYIAPSASLSGYVASSASLSGYVAPSSSITTGSASLSGYVAPSLTGGSPLVTGAVATAPSTALSGVTASITVPTISPTLTYSSIIKW